MMRTLLVVPFFALAVSACNDPTADKPKAVVSSASTSGSTAAAPSAAATTGSGGAVAPAVLTPPAPPAGAWPIDTAKSSIGFVGAKVTGTHTGAFSRIAGWVALRGDKPEDAKAAFVIDIGSLKTDSEKLDGHLRGEDFFDIAKYPTATFTTTAIKPGADKNAPVAITGDLDLHGTKKGITFPATIAVTADAITATAEFSINRRDFSINYPGKANDLIKDEVLLKISLVAPKSK